MEYRIKDYTIKGQRILLPRQTSIEDLRLIFNETQKKLICSTATKDNVSLTQGEGGTSVEVPTSVCSLNSTDLLTIKCDYGDNLEEVKDAVETQLPALADKIDNIKLPEIDTTELAKQGENQEATNSKILEGINSIANSMVTSLQEKVVTPKSYIQEVTPDNDKLALKKVTVMGYTPEVVKINNSEFDIPSAYRSDINEITTNNLQGDYAVAIGMLFLDTLDSISLNFADAYKISDGAFYDYATTHTFEDSEYPDKWVVCYFKSEDAILNISGFKPVEICVRGHIAGIQSTEAGILEKILVPDGSSVGYLNFTSTQRFVSHHLKNIDKHESGTMIFQNDAAFGTLVIGVKELAGGYLVQNRLGNVDVLVIEVERITGGSCIYNYNVNTSSRIKEIHFPNLVSVSGTSTAVCKMINYGLNNLQKITFPKLESITSGLFMNKSMSSHYVNKLTRIDFPKVTTFRAWLWNGDATAAIYPNLSTIRFDVLKEANAQLYQSEGMACTFEYPELEVVRPLNKHNQFKAIGNANRVVIPKLRVVNNQGAWQYTGVIVDGTSREVWNLLPELEEVVLGSYEGFFFYPVNANEIHLPKLKSAKVLTYDMNNEGSAYARCSLFGDSQANYKTTIASLYLESIENYKVRTSYNASKKVNLDYVYLGCKGTPSDVIYFDAGIADTYTKDIEIGVGARQSIQIVNYNGLTAENIALHILDKLADNTDGDTITIRIGATNLATINADATYSPYVALAQAKNYTII